MNSDYTDWWFYYSGSCDDEGSCTGNYNRGDGETWGVWYFNLVGFEPLAVDNGLCFMSAWDRIHPQDWISDCQCHGSCYDCGFYSTPTNPDDCIECAPGHWLDSVYSDGTGYCRQMDAGGPPAGGSCFRSAWDRIHPQDIIADCQCHSSCNDCGFYGNP